MAQGTKTKWLKAVEVDGVNLFLTMNEARTLQAVLSQVAGNPKTTWRGRCDGIAKALTAAIGELGYEKIRGQFSGSPIYPTNSRNEVRVYAPWEDPNED